MAENLAEMVQRAREAQKVIEFWDQEKVDEMVLAVGWEGYKKETAEEVARLAVDETGLGVYENKVVKQQKKTLGVLRDLRGVKTVGVIEELPEKGYHQGCEAGRCDRRHHPNDQRLIHNDL